MKQLAKRLSLTVPPVRRIYEELLNARAELDNIRKEAEKEKAVAPPAAHKEPVDVSEFINRWFGKDLITQARANLFAAKALQSVSEQPPLGSRWDDYSKKLIGDIEQFDSIVQAITYAQTEIGFETRPHEDECRDFIDVMENLINTSYPDCAEMISRAGESPLSLLTHNFGVIKRGEKLLALQQVCNLEIFCYNVSKLGRVPRSVLEIGGGYGSSCRDMINMSQDRLEKYYILDIPESLFYSEIYLKVHFGSSTVGHLAAPHVAERMDDFRIILCPLPMVDRLSSLPIDLAINVGSMQEMSGDWLEYYDHFLSGSQIKHFYNSNYFLQPLQKLKEGMNLFTPRLSNKWKPLSHQFMLDTDGTDIKADCRQLVRGIFVKESSEEGIDALMKDIALIEGRSPGQPIDNEGGEAVFRLMLAIRRDVAMSAPMSLQVLRAMTTRFPYIPKEALYLARFLSGRTVELEKEARGEVEQLCRKLEGLLQDDRKDVT